MRTIDITEKSVPFEEISQDAVFVEDLYRRKQMEIKEGSPFGCALRAAKTLPKLRKKALEGLVSPSKVMPEVYDAFTFSRIANALKILASKNNMEHHLNRLMKGTIATSEPEQSSAKDFAFEVMVTARLEVGGFASKLKEPDTSFYFNNRQFGVACKNLYSESNIEHNLKGARKQIVRSKKHGLIALCIDHFVVEGQICQTDTVEGLYMFLDDACSRFVEKNRKILKEQRSSSRHILAYIISASTIVDIQGRFGTADFWMIYSLVPSSSPYYKLLYELSKRSGNSIV